MKVALVCDWLTESGGAEEVIKKFHEIYPTAPIYTSQYRKGRTPWLKGSDVRTGYLNFFPVKSRRFIAPLRQKYFKNLNLDEYDLVISITGCDAKLIKTNGTHLCYCHVPTQYYWGKREEYLKNPGFGLLNPLARAMYKKFLPILATVDLESARNPDEFVTISNFAKREIKTYYKREAKVVNPPVNYALFSQFVENYNTKKWKSQIKILHNKTTKKQKCQAPKSEQKFYTGLKNVENLSALTEILTKYPNGFYLNFSRQVNWKNLDLLIKTCKKLKLPLVLVGNGPENKNLKHLASNSPFITFVDFLGKTDLAFLASLSKAFIFPSEEPFGIAPIEAMSAGCPVIALKKGGALDYIKEGKNGFFFEKPTIDSLEKILKKFEARIVPLDRKKVSKSVEKFSSENFDKNWEKITKKLSKKSHSSLGRSSKTPKNSLKSFLFYSFPAILFFSFFPSLKLGETDSMYLELSLPLIWLALFSLISLKDVLRYLKTNFKTPLLLFPLFLALSVLWSKNPLRGFLTFGVSLCIFISIISFILFIKISNLEKNPWREKLRKIIFTSTTLICFFCIFQAIFDTLGIERNATLLCEGCVSKTFGFPHVNGFAVEPQFMGSLLLAPILLVFNSLLKNKTRKSQIRLVTLLTLFLFTLFLTFSRGTIFALFFMLLTLVFKNLKSLKNLLKIVGIPLLSLFLTLNFQGLLAELGPTNVSYQTAIKTSINQLSLGKIDFTTTDALSTEFPEPPITPLVEEPLFSGYIAESTDRRLELATYALKIWSKNPTNTLFGTGLGSSGTVMLEDFPSQGIKKEIVQNEYLEVLLETGLIGIIFLILSVVTFIKLEHLKLNFYFVALLLAYAVSILFFSGLPNALHIYLLPLIWYNLLHE